MDILTLINGNGDQYQIKLPAIVIIDGHKWNDEGLAHIEKQTGLTFEPCMNGIKAQPTESKQIVALLMSHDFKTRYYNNSSRGNEIVLKSDHHVGWDVNSICYECCVHNNIHTGNMVAGGRLAC